MPALRRGPQIIANALSAYLGYYLLTIRLDHMKLLALQVKCHQVLVISYGSI